MSVLNSLEDYDLDKESIMGAGMKVRKHDCETAFGDYLKLNIPKGCEKVRWQPEVGAIGR